MIYLWDMYHEGLWENRNNYTYYTEFILEISSLCVQFMHHLHMLIWANMFLSVASLILLMKLRFLYQEIQRKLKRHNNYILVKTTLEKRFLLFAF
jgi:autocrine motility factor receptor